MEGKAYKEMLEIIGEVRKFPEVIGWRQSR
jgi:hypothetical protein